MSIDELIEALWELKREGVNGDTPVLVDTFEGVGDYPIIHYVNTTSRTMDDLDEELLDRYEAQYFPTIVL